MLSYVDRAKHAEGTETGAEQVNDAKYPQKKDPSGSSEGSLIFMV